ncbi:MAG TPA: SDR family NAD(P)-dependent oxidoreductase [Streptosporangiaceae bacterium]|nr:SDR family NAD(P)-dependent oxidoreductase [Streptosporangiaceae bacterium]
MADLKNKTAVITGAGSGIGRAIAQCLAGAGARVLVLDIDGERAAAVAGEIVAADGSALALAADVSRAADCQAGIETAVRTWGGVDVLVNNAGIIRRADAVSTTEEEWDLVMAVNVRSVFLMCKYAIPVMSAGTGGAIVNTASGWGLKGGPNAISYCASKGAVVNMTRALAIDHGPQGIRVNAVCPGDTDTPMLREEARQLGIDAGQFLAEAADRPLGRMGSPREIAQAVLWLASDASSYVTGTAIPVDGGGIA